MQHDLAQLFVDDLLLRFSELSTSFVQRSRLHHETQRSGRDRVGSDLDLAGEFARSEVVILPFEPEQTARRSRGP